MNPILKIYNEVNTFGRLLGMRIEVIKPGEVVYRLLVTESHLSNPLAAHGGAIAALMDGALGVAALSLAVEDHKLVSTVEYKLNFFAPIELGDMLVAHGKVIQAGKRLMYSEGSIYCENRSKLLVSKGLGTFNAYPVDKNSLFAEAQ